MEKQELVPISPIIINEIDRDKPKVDNQIKQFLKKFSNNKIEATINEVDNNINKKSKKILKEETIIKINNNNTKQRETWSSRYEFISSSLGYSMGLISLWRFPYICYKNGGVIFLIPYFILLILIGIPLFCLEVALGQYTSQGVLSCWKMAPIFKVILLFFLSFFYSIFIHSNCRVLELE
jgi:hypothetical protein